jgi:hypothetical protein
VLCMLPCFDIYFDGFFYFTCGVSDLVGSAICFPTRSDKQNCQNSSTAFYDCNNLTKVTYSCIVNYILIM